LLQDSNSIIDYCYKINLIVVTYSNKT